VAYVLSDDALIDWDTLARYLGEPTDFDSADEQFGIRLINAASARANTITKRKLASREYTDLILDGNGADMLLLPQWPVTVITEIRIDSARDFGDDTVLDSDEYGSYGDGRVFILGYLPSARRCVMVTYTAGYVTVPDDLQDAVIEAIAYTWKRTKSRSIGTRSTTADGVTTQYEIDIPIPAMRVFETYRKMR